MARAYGSQFKMKSYINGLKSVATIYIKPTALKLQDLIP